MTFLEDYRKRIILKVKSWRKIAKKYDDYFIKFALEYFAFIALLRINYSKNEYVIDRNLIDSLKKSIRNNRNIIKESNIRDLKTLLDEKPLRKWKRDGSYEPIWIKSLDDFDSVIEAVYQIRNNLFHGRKGHNICRDQNLVKVGYNILTDINDFLLRKFYTYDYTS